MKGLWSSKPIEPLCLLAITRVRNERGLPLQVLLFAASTFFCKKEKKKTADSCIFPPAATIAFTRSAERKQSGYCVPLEWPAPILRAPTPPTMTTRGTDMRCCRCRCRCRPRAPAILWSPRVVPLSVFNFPSARSCDD